MIWAIPFGYQPVCGEVLRSPITPTNYRGFASMALLEVNDVEVRFGGIVALSGMTFDIEEGQICGLIGPNGAGKTTMFNVISRVIVFWILMKIQIIH